MGRATGEFGEECEHDRLQPGTAPRQTITLSQGRLELSNPSYLISLDGPGAEPGEHQWKRCQPRFPGHPPVAASISGLTITGVSTYRTRTTTKAEAIERGHNDALGLHHQRKQ